MASPQTDRAGVVNSSVAIKAPCRVVTTGSDISDVLSGGGLPVIDGVQTVAGDRVLVRDQTNQTQNGIYVASVFPWVRDVDFDGSNDAVPGTLIWVSDGTVCAGSFWRVMGSAPIVIGTSAITFSPDAFINEVTATSSTSTVVIATGDVTLTINVGRQFQAGQFVVATDSSSLSNWIYGGVISYDALTGTLVVDVMAIGGSGTPSGWNVSISAPPSIEELAITSAASAVASAINAAECATAVTVTAAQIAATAENIEQTFSADVAEMQSLVSEVTAFKSEVTQSLETARFHSSTTTWADFYAAASGAAGSRVIDFGGLTASGAFADELVPSVRIAFAEGNSSINFGGL